jgi:hypothetical protein
MSDSSTKHDSEVAEKAKPVSDRVQILEIRLLESRSEQKRFTDDAVKRIMQNVQVETHVDNAQSRLEVFPHFTLLVRRQDGSPEDVFVRIEARFAITYAINALEGLVQPNYDAFGERNGIYNAWPYWREFVQSTTVRMGLPPLTFLYSGLGWPNSNTMHGFSVRKPTSNLK